MFPMLLELWPNPQRVNDPPKPRVQRDPKAAATDAYPRTVSQVRDETRDKNPDHKVASGFTIDRSINVDGRVYNHLVSIYNMPGHFISIVTYNNHTWAGGLDLKSDRMTYIGPEPFVCKDGIFHGAKIQPVLHVYIVKPLDENKDEVQGEDGGGEDGDDGVKLGSVEL